LQRGGLVTSRDDYLLSITSGKRVVHVGCVDWPLSQERLRDGSLLHEKLLLNAESVLGVDVDTKGMERLQNTLGGLYSNIDLTDSDVNTNEVTAFKPDVILAGDVIEHVSSGQDLLNGLARLVNETEADLVLTTPNSLAIRNVFNTALGLEMVHPDHSCIYSPLNLRTLVERSGLQVQNWTYYSIKTGHDPMHRLYDSMSRLPARIRHAWADGHIVQCGI